MSDMVANQGLMTPNSGPGGGGGGAGNPSPPVGSVQYNNAGSFGGFGNWDGVQVLSIANGTNPQSFDTYGYVDNITSPTNFSRFRDNWVDDPNGVTFIGEAGGTQTSIFQNVTFVAPVRYRFFVGPSIAGGTEIFTCSAAFGGQLVTGNGVQLIVYGLGGGGNNVVLGNPASAGVPCAGVLNLGNAGPGNSVAGNGVGWLQWGGTPLLDQDFSATSNTTLANVAGSTYGLTANIKHNHTYSLDVSLPMATGPSAGGIKIGLSGTATFYDMIADGICMDGTTPIAVTRITALGQMVGNTNTGTTPYAMLRGLLHCSGDGTVSVQFAQNASNATASTVKRGAYMILHDMAEV